MPDYDDALVEAVLESQRKIIEAYKPFDLLALEDGPATLARAAIAAVLEWQEREREYVRERAWIVSE